MWRVAAMTGLRRGELAGLRWSDVDLEGDALAPGRVHVRQQYASDGEGHFDFTPPKSDQGRRTIDLDPTTVNVLKAHQKNQLELRMALGAGRPELVFEKEPDVPLRPDSSVSAAFDRIVRKLDVPNISVHGLRHTHTSHLVAGGMDLKGVSARMGHASVSFTLDRYGHLLPGQQAQVAGQVAAVIDRTA